MIKIEVDSLLNFKAVTFEVLENYINKDDLSVKTIYTYMTAGGCGASINLNDEWYIHSMLKGNLNFSSRCGRSAILTIPDLLSTVSQSFYEEISDVWSGYKYVEWVMSTYTIGLRRFNNDIMEMKKYYCQYLLYCMGSWVQAY